MQAIGSCKLHVGPRADVRPALMVKWVMLDQVFLKTCKRTQFPFKNETCFPLQLYFQPSNPTDMDRVVQVRHTPHYNFSYDFVSRWRGDWNYMPRGTGYGRFCRMEAAVQGRAFHHEKRWKL